MGFRWQAMRFAQSLGLTGVVDNLWDGRVEMEVQGEEDMIWKLMKTLNNQLYIRIDDVDVEDIPLKKGESGFRVKGY